MNQISTIANEYSAYIGGFWRFIKNHTYTSIVVAALIIAAITYEISKGCISRYDFSNASEAIDCYSDFLAELRDCRKVNADELADKIKDWQELSDTIFSFASKDSLFLSHAGMASSIYLTHDSIRGEFVRLAGTFQPTYEDILTIKEETNPFRYEEKLEPLAEEADKFYESLDTATLYNDDALQLLARYSTFLNSVDQLGVHDKSDLLKFLRSEDRIFRSYLSHLPEYNGISLTDVTKKTESVCNNIAKSIDGRMNADEALVYLKKRTARRLLQNSTCCIDNILNNHLRSKEVGYSYLWMIVQPFIFIDSFTLAVMTDEEKDTLHKIATNVPKLADHVGKLQTTPDILTRQLPDQILKCYISSLCP